MAEVGDGGFGYDEVVDFNRVVSTYFGIWPQDPLNCWAVFKVSLAFCAELILVLPQTYKLCLVMSDFNELIDVLTTAWLVVAVSTLKLVTMLTKRRELTLLLNEMKEDWENCKGESTRLGIMRKEVGLVRFMVRFSVYSATTTSVAMQLHRIIMNHLYDQNEFLLSSAFPESVPSEDSPLNQILWVLMFSSILASGLVFSNFDGYFAITIFHLCAQIRILRADIRNSVSRSRKHGSFLQIIRPVVRRHLQLKGFAGMIEESFNRVFLLQMLVFSITICLQLYTVVVNLTGDVLKNLPTIIYILVFTMANVFSLLIYCLVGEKLRTESSKIFDEAYNADWYDLKPREAKTLVIIMCASQNPLVITAGKFTALSLNYFTKILKTAVGYCSMLIAVKAKIS